MKNTFAALALIALSSTAFAQATPVGQWHTIDDKTNEIKSLIVISESAGVLSGRIDKLLRKGADQDAKCTECTDDRKDKPLLGLEIIRGAKKADGKDVWEVGQQGQQVPVAKGWLRASHRKLDPKLTLPYRPYHAHNERQWLEPGVPVECEIEIWPIGMVFRKGHRIRIDIQPRDGVGSTPYNHYPAAYNTNGQNTVHTGGKMASYLLLPVIPAKKSR